IHAALPISPSLPLSSSSLVAPPLPVGRSLALRPLDAPLNKARPMVNPHKRANVLIRFVFIFLPFSFIVPERPAFIHSYACRQGFPLAFLCLNLSRFCF